MIILRLIVGLGNPGKVYVNTRHNVGFMIIDNYCNKKNILINNDKFMGLYAQTVIKNEKVIFLKPQKYMNLSGEVVRDYVNYFKINIDDILVINDDLDIQVGKFKLKSKGSSGGHNGLKNIGEQLGNYNFKRLKIGISNNKLIDTKNYVLGRFSQDDQETINKLIDLSVNIIDDFLTTNFDLLMTKYNNN